MMVRTRFAPSPTGRIHIGHAYAAWVAWQLANAAGGQFLLRHEDIDSTRVRPVFHQWIEQDLQWLQLPWQQVPLRQSARTAAYLDALNILKQRDVVYPCFCTRREIQEELARIGAAPHDTEAPPYPGNCRNLTSDQQQQRLQAGTPHSWRLNAPRAAKLTGNLSFHDLRHGFFPVAPNLLGDVVLARKDIGVAYHLAVVVDDAFQAITHVTRGEDLLPSTHVHRLLQSLLGLPQPVYLHHPLVVDQLGKRLSKRAESATIDSFRQHGLSPQDVLNLAKAGMPPLPELNLQP